MASVDSRALADGTGTERDGFSSRIVTRAWPTIIPAGLYLLVRAVGVLAWWALTAGTGRVNPAPWDADWYLRIAELGYRGAAVGMTDAHGNASPDGAMAFFPGYPLLVRLVATIAGHNYLAAGIAVSTVAGIIGAYGVARLARHMGATRGKELAAVVLVAAAPMSVVYAMAYPEALLVALTVWTLVAMRERRWWLAGVCTAAAGLVSPMAVPLIVVVMVAGFVDMYRHGADRGGAAFAVMVSPLGVLGYLLWVHETSTVPGGYFEISGTGWGNHVDLGVTVARWVLKAFTEGSSAYVLITAALIIASIVGVVVARMWWPAWLYTALTVGLVVVHSGLVQDRVRLLLSAFPLLIIAAMKLRTRYLVPVVLAGLWFGAYSVAVWPYAI